MTFKGVSYITRFNPCYNGSGVRSFNYLFVHLSCILGFNPCYNGSGVRRDIQRIYPIKKPRVSILVIMEVG